MRVPRRTVHRPAFAALLTCLLSCLALLALATPPASAAPAASAVAPSGPVVVVGMAGVRWADVDADRTPALASLVRGGAIGDVAVRSVRTATCPVEGWLALSAGRRAGDTPVPGAEQPNDPPCRPFDVDGTGAGGTGAGGTGAGAGAGGTGADSGVLSAVVRNWSRYVDAARAEKFGATPGLLGDTLQRAGVCATAYGPGAGVALARSDGSLGRYHPLDPGAGAQLTPSYDCPLTVLDAGTVRDPQDAPLGPAEQGVATTTGSRAEQVQAVDRLVGQVLDTAPQDARVVVVSVADSGRTPHLQLVGARGPGFRPGWLRTSSTRQAALVQLTDLTPTVLNLLGIAPPTGLVGSPLHTLTAASGQAPDDPQARLEKVLDLDQAAQAVRPLVGPFFTGLVLAQILLYGLAAVVLRRRWAEGPGRARVLAWVRRLSLVFATVPVATYLANTVPWWRASSPLLVVVLVVLGYVVLLSAVAQLGPWARRPLGAMGAVAALTAVILAVDIVTGSRLQTSSLMGLQPVVAGRFFGFSNVAYALFATGALLLAVAVADHLVQAGRRTAAAVAVAVTGVVATALDVSPAWGSDFGGPIAMVPAFAVLTLLVLDVRLSWIKAGLIAVGTIVVLTAVSVVDWLRPTDQQTHLGRFVQTVIDGGALQVIARKAEQNVAILTGSVLSLLIPFAAVFVALVLMRPSSWGARALQRAYDRSPTLRHGLVCLLLLLGIGFAVNDSGTVIPAVGATLAIPLVIAVSMRALQDDAGADIDREPVSAPAAPAGRSPAP